MSKERRPFASYIVVQVKGPHLEAFLNRCAEEGLYLWNISRPASNMLITYMSPYDFRSVRRIAREQGWQFRILERKGFAFSLRRLMQRKSFVVGAFCAMIIWYALSLHVWFINVEGVDRVDANEVLLLAAEAGLFPGAMRSRLDREDVQRSILIGNQDLVWAAVEIRGTRATIRVAERKLPEDTRSSRPGHVVAARDGVIERISVLDGHAVVEPGMTVRKGEVLISGLLEPGSQAFLDKLEAGELPYIHADGTVLARVWYETVIEVMPGPLELTEDARKRAESLVLEQVLVQVEGDSARPVGTPLLESIWDDEQNVWWTRVLLEAEMDIGQFLPIDP